MKKKYQVFISSTYMDLKNERLAAQEAVLKTQNLPVGMEQFSASEKKQWELITEDIDSSDYYVLIIGKRYGSEVSGEGISWTQKEFRYALDKEIPVLAFIKDDSVKTPEKFVEKDKKTKKKLQEFIKEVEDHSTVDYWKNKDDIKFLVSVALEKAIRTHPRPGWVRSRSNTPRQASPNSYEQMALNYIASIGESSTTKVARNIELSLNHTKMLLNYLLTEGKIQQHNSKWQILRTKDDLVSYDNYRSELLDIMDRNGHIIQCDCGTHFWGNDFYSEELVSEVINELKNENLYNSKDKKIIKLAIKDICDEADPTFDDCPGCGMPRRRISGES